MPFLKDASVTAIQGDADKKLESLVQQVNEWARLISNEQMTKIYKDESGTNRIVVGLLPDKTVGLVMSKDGEDVLTVFD